MIKVTESEVLSLTGPNQIFGEWKAYLQFVQAYCVKHCLTNPVIVELGAQHGRQKAHYTRFLDATHIGIDMSDKWSKPDILGNTHAPETLKKLKALLGDKKINLLFIDATHTYVDALADYLVYGPLTTDIIAFHDISHEKEIGQLWKDIQASEKDNLNISFISIGAWANGWCELGIGIIVKHGQDEIKDITNGFGIEKKHG